MSSGSVKIAANLENLNLQIVGACRRASRTRQSVTLIAVSKLKPLADLVSAVRAGVSDLGENYVQEWREKNESWPAAVARPRWHLIGPLQTNKVKYVVGKVHLIHSVDRIELADEIAKRSRSLGIRQKILIQIKIGMEKTKHGVELGAAGELLETAAAHASLEVCGVMALPPLVEREAIARGFFRQVVSARNDLVAYRPVLKPLLVELSMGTSGDFLWAIEEGATMIRVGTAIFGDRG